MTLCHEDEIGALSAAELGSRLSGTERVMLRFGVPEAFADHGILLPFVDGRVGFQELREWGLGSSAIGRLEAHITLASENPKAPGNSIAAAASLTGLAIAFDTALLIEQTGAETWGVLRSFVLVGAGGTMR